VFNTSCQGRPGRSKGTTSKVWSFGKKRKPVVQEPSVGLHLSVVPLQLPYDAQPMPAALLLVEYAGMHLETASPVA
jgi:hypothetical protein